MRKTVIVILVVLITSGLSFAGDILKNSDLEQYKDLPVDQGPSHAWSKSTIGEEREYKTLVNKVCRKWLMLQNDLEKAEEELEYSESEYNRYHRSKTYEEQARDKYRRAERVVENLKEKIKDFEDDAYRKNLPKLSYECDYYDVFD